MRELHRNWQWGGVRGGGFAHDSNDGGTLRLTNCILWSNFPNEIIDTPAETGSGVTVAFSTIQGGWPGEGNTESDPLFENVNANDFRLSAGYPPSDSGNSAALPLDVADLDGDGILKEPVPLDLGGDPRVVDDPDSPDCPQLSPGSCLPPTVDMGAYEFVPPPP